MSANQQQEGRHASHLARHLRAGGLSRRGLGDAGRPEQTPWTQARLDQQQALLVAVLRRAGGETVSYEQLRDSGVEYPASVVSELELTGFPVERSFGAAGAPGGRLGVRLEARAISSDPQLEQPTPPLEDRAALPPAPRPASPFASVARRGQTTGASLLALAGAGAAATAEAARTLRSRLGSAAARRPRAPRVSARWIAPALLLVAIALLATLIATGPAATSSAPRKAAVSGHASASSTRRHSVSHHPTGARHTRAATVRPAPAPPAPAASASPPRRATTSPSPTAASAAELEARGHALLAAGETQAAILTLTRAAAATRESQGACTEPAGEACLTYAYALYDLGRARRLNREPAAAVSILERRLKIDNQRATVLGELQRARREAAGRAPAKSKRAERGGAQAPPGLRGLRGSGADS